MIIIGIAIPIGPKLSENTAIANAVVTHAGTS